jgi:hypothetical protein
VVAQTPTGNKQSIQKKLFSVSINEVHKDICICYLLCGISMADCSSNGCRMIPIMVA